MWMSVEGRSTLGGEEEDVGLPLPSPSPSPSSWTSFMTQVMGISPQSTRNQSFPHFPTLLPQNLMAQESHKLIWYVPISIFVPVVFYFYFYF
jgi:hypothetical protein